MYESCNFFISLPTLASFFFSILATLVSIMCYLVVILIYISLMTDVETSFMCFLAICIATLVSLCCKFFVYFLKIGIF